MFVLKTNEVIIGDNIKISYKPANLPALPNSSAIWGARFPMWITRTVCDAFGCTSEHDEILVYLHNDDLRKLYNHPEQILAEIETWSE